MMAKGQTFIKDERLCSNKDIQELFRTGRSHVSYPLRIIWTIKDYEERPPVKILISVSSRYFHSAVIRNLLKRFIRESFRKNKKILYQKLEKNHICLDVGCLYIGKEPADYNEIEKRLISGFRYLVRQLEILA